MSRPVPTRASSRARTTTPAPAAKATRATRARTASKAISEDPAPEPVKKPATRKPLSKRDNVDTPPPSKGKTKPPSTKPLKQAAADETEREAIMAYLRIRPRIGEEPSTSPYLVPISDAAVRMTDPQDSQNIRPQYRASVVQPSSIYTFSHVFPPETQQSDFFTKTTLPLVKDLLLQGQSGLLFTYGVTNSGKTYTVQGGQERGTAGILPRTLDVIFNSIEGLHGDGRYRPVRLHGVEPADATDLKPPQISSEPAVAQVLQSLDDPSEPDFDIDPTVIPVDRNHQYTVWLSYAEVYNEKVYDLLASARDDSMSVDSTVPRAGNSKIPLLTRQALTLRPSPPSDNPDSDIGGKYISGLRQFRVQSAAQAKSLVKLGQLHRRVFGTLANRESSRSHGMVIIKVMRGHRGESDNPSALQIARLTLVDLAGSERTKHTHTTGDRLKEAGNINKSLMVLGQCMEVLRSNQRKLAMSLAHEGVGVHGRVDTRDVKRTLPVIPFRHSKLTEALMDYFIGDGRVVMIVNINPYDTGYDENSHIMRFAALAREVYTTPAPAPVQRLPPNFGPGKTKGNKIKEPGPLSLRGSDITPKPYYRRKVTISMGGRDSSARPNEAIVEVVEEEEEPDDNRDDDDDDEPANPLVDALFEEIERLRIQLLDAELRCALIEADTREEVMHEMEERMHAMERMYSRRLMSEVEQNEMKTDAKIDMLHQAGLFASPLKRSETLESLSEAEEEDIEMSLVQNTDEDEAMSEATKSRASSPLARKDKGKSTNPFVQMGTHPGASKKNPTTETTDGDEELTDLEDDEETSQGSEDDEDMEEEDDEDYEESQPLSDDEDDWVPSSTTKKRTPAKPKGSRQSTSRSGNVASAGKKPSRVSKLANEIDSSLKLSDSKGKPAPKKKPRSSLDTDSEGEGEEEDIPAPKKKRQLAKKTIVTVDGVEQVSWEAEKLNGQGKTIRRLGS